MMQQGGNFLNSQTGQSIINNAMNGLVSMMSNSLQTRQQNKELKKQKQLNDAQYQNNLTKARLQKAQQAKNIAAAYLQQKQSEFDSGLSNENPSSIVAQHLGYLNSGGDDLQEMERLKKKQDDIYQQELIGNRTNGILSGLMQFGQTAFQFGKDYKQFQNNRLEAYRNLQQNNQVI